MKSGIPNKLKSKWLVILFILLVLEIFIQIKGAVTILSLLFFVAAISVLLYVVFKKIDSHFEKKERKIFFPVYAVLNAVLLIFLIVEIGLRIAGINNENGGALAYAIRAYDTMPWFLTYEPNQTDDDVYSSSEFNYVVSSNSLGLRDKEWKREKSGFRIITLGDSFTEGVGSPMDSTWSPLLQGMMTNPPVEVLNAGVQSSDPYFSMMLLKSKLLEYHPDMLILMINSTDIDDIMVRGGYERFKVIHNDSVAVNRPDPWWVRNYGMSYSFRYVMRNILNYDYYLISQEELIAEQKIARTKLTAVLHDFENLSLEKGFRFVVVVQPLSYHVPNKCSETMNLILGDSIPLKQSQVIDLCQEMASHYSREIIKTFYWQMDGHMKPEGNLEVARLLADKIDFTPPEHAQ